MNNTVLYKRSSFFVDLLNVVFYADVFLYHELKKRGQSDQSLQCYFDTIYESDVDDVQLKQITAAKKNQNILLDWLNLEHFKEINGDTNPEQFLASLYQSMLAKPECDQYLQLTEFGHALKLLTRDINLTRVFCYLPFTSNFIIENLHRAFNGTDLNKLNYAIGNKRELIETTTVQSYVFENVLDIDKYLPVKHPNCIEVLIPSYEYNLMEDRSKLEQTFEDVTYKRLRLEHEPQYYTEEFNLSINTISVPI